MVGISYQGIAQWENDLREMKLQTIVKFAEALDVSPTALLPDYFINAMFEFNIKKGNEYAQQN